MTRGQRPITPLAVRFASKYRVREDGCWEWTASKTKGYGRIRGEAPEFKMQWAHRVAWELKIGPIPDDKVIDHICKKPYCVNVDHLQLVTQVQNVMLGDSPQAVNARKEVCGVCGGPYTWGSRGGKPRRHCRACKRQKMQATRIKRG